MPCLMLLLAGCSAFGAAGGATIGAGVGFLGGPVTTVAGAALGAFVGDLVADSDSPSEGAAAESVWSLMGKIVDAAPMLLILAIILWVLSLCAPSPLTWLKKKLKNRKQRDSSD